VQLPKGKYNEIEGYIRLNEPKTGVEVTLNIPELKITKAVTTDNEGKATFNLKAKPQLWSPDVPKLYNIEIVKGEEVLKDRIGFRQIETQGKSVLLNGKKTFLRGISIHEEAPYRQGRVFSKEEAGILLGWAKELGCNFVRLAHYPHNEHTVRVAEELGLMVWSEIPVYWTIHWNNPDTYKNASRQLNDMMERDKNRCAVVVWSIANETPHSDARDTFLGNLAEQARAKDNTRLISMAMEVTGTRNNVSQVQDNMNKYVDIVSFNSYLGWYTGTIEDCKTRQWEISYDKPFFISEFGGGALQGLHGDKTERWTEEYQEELYKQTLGMYDRTEGFAGTSPWILMDFRSARRQLHGVQDFFNRKGIISDRGIKKKAFYVLQDFYKKKAIAESSSK
jgi:beta-glucuronidase